MRGARGGSEGGSRVEGIAMSSGVSSPEVRSDAQVVRKQQSEGGEG